MPRFLKESVIHASAERVWAFHEAPDAFERLQPRFPRTRVIQPPTSLAVGTRVVAEVGFPPFWQRMVAEHVAYEPGRMFADRMLEGPFAQWHHRHVIMPLGEDRCTLTDDIAYELPLGAVGRIFGGPIARTMLNRMFAHRHAVTRAACEGAPSADRG